MLCKATWRHGLTMVLCLTLLAISLSPGTAHGERARAVKVFDEEFPVGRGASIDVEVHDADVDFVPSDGSGIQIRVFAHIRDGGDEWAREVFERSAFTVRKMDNTLVIRTEEPHIVRSEYRGKGHVWLQIRIAHPVSLDCAVTTGDGDVSIEEIDGEVAVHTGDGDIRLESVRGGSLEVHTGDGDIAIETLNSSDASLQTGDGDVSVSSLNGSLEVRTGDGDIEVALDDPGDVQLETGDGDISIRAKSDLRADVEFRGEDVSVQDFRISGRLSGNVIRGQINGGGSLLRATSGDGDVALRGI